MRTAGTDYVRIVFAKELEQLKSHVAVEPLAPEGSREWALWQMLNGKKVKHERDAANYYYMNENGMLVNKGGQIIEDESQWLKTSSSAGWQIYEEPKPKPEVGKWYWNKVHKEYCYAIKLNDDVMEMRSAGSLSTYGFDVMEIDDLVETSLEPDFNNAKVGDKCFSAVEGNGTVMEALDLFVDFPVKSQRSCKYIKYQRNGKLYEASIHPTLFHSAAQCAAYFAEVALEERGEQ